MAESAIGITTGGAPGRRERRRAILIVGVVAALLALVGLVLLFGYYAIARRPLTDLPVVDRAARTIPPRPLFSFGQMASPVGLAVSPDGQRVFVAEGGGNRQIRVFDRDGKPLGELAPPGSNPGTRKPGHLALDSGGRLYAVDRLRATIDMYTPALRWEGMLQSPAIDDIGGWLPNGVSVAPDGHIYVAEIGQEEQSILVLAPDGALVDRLGKSSGLPAGLNYPDQAVVDDEGRVYVSDGNNGRVIAISPAGVNVVGASGKEAIGMARGMAIGDGKLFVADAASHRVAVFSLGDQPQFLYTFGDSNDEQGMAFPNAVGIDRTGRVYVADRGNNRVQVWTY